LSSTSVQRTSPAIASAVIAKGTSEPSRRTTKSPWSRRYAGSNGSSDIVVKSRGLMPNDISYLLQEYDGLASAVVNANQALYQQRLMQWFSFIDETPSFTAVVSKLESLNDFDAWYGDLASRQRNHGMGGAQLNFPRDRDTALGMQITLFRRMARNSFACQQYVFYPDTKQYDDCLQYVGPKRSILPSPPPR